MNYSKAVEKEHIKDGEVIFYQDTVTNNVIVAINGVDNKKYYSFDGVKEDGIVSHPKNLSMFDIWFTQQYSMKEITGFAKLVEECKESFEPKKEEINKKYGKVRCDTICGKISPDRNKIQILGSADSDITIILGYLRKQKLIYPETHILFNDRYLGMVGKVIVDNRAPIMITAQNQYGDDVEIINLIEKYKATHDNDAAEQLILKYDKLIQAVVKKETRKWSLPADAIEDIIQESHIKLLSLLERFDSSKSTLTTYVYKAITNMVHNAIRDYKMRHDMEKPFVDKETKNNDPRGVDPKKFTQNREPAPSANLESQEQSTSIQEAINGLPENQQKIINLYFYSGKTLEEIGQEFGVTKERIRQVINNSLDSLKQRLQGTGLEAMKIAMLFNNNRIQLFKGKLNV